MTISEVISLLPRRAAGLAGRRDETAEPVQKPGQRVREAMLDAGNADTLLAQLREVIVGPTRRLGEARFEELLDILTEQDQNFDTRCKAIEQELDEVGANMRRIEDLYFDMDRRMNDIDARIEAERDVARQALEAAISAMRAEVESKLDQMHASLQDNIRAVASGNNRDFRELSDTLAAHVADTENILVRAQEVSLTALEQRIAQWRAEIEDDRRQDMEEVAKGLVDIGQRLTGMRRMD